MIPLLLSIARQLQIPNAPASNILLLQVGNEILCC